MKKVISQAIVIGSDQEKVSELLENIYQLVKGIESTGGSVSDVILTQKNDYDEQTNVDVYYDQDSNAEAGTVLKKIFTTSAETEKESVILLLNEVSDWIKDQDDSFMLLSILTNFYAGSPNIGLAKVYYSKYE